MSAERSATTGPRPSDRLPRHARASRLLHWTMAVSVLVLLGTAFLPLLGWQFPWVGVHWITGMILSALVALHAGRALLWQDPRSMWFGGDDLKASLAVLLRAFRVRSDPPPRLGKYSPAQKLIHHVFVLLVVVTIVTGFLMLVKIDTPWWERDPYWLSEATWGVVYVLHDLAALILVTMIMLHVYFALRPEKLHFLRAMVLGWVTRTEFEKYHDGTRWNIDAE